MVGLLPVADPLDPLQRVGAERQAQRRSGRLDGLEDGSSGLRRVARLCPVRLQVLACLSDRGFIPRDGLGGLGRLRIEEIRPEGPLTMPRATTTRVDVDDWMPRRPDRAARELRSPTAPERQPVADGVDPLKREVPDGKSELL